MKTLRTAFALIVAAGLNTAAFAQTTPNGGMQTTPTNPNGGMQTMPTNPNGGMQTMPG